MQAFLTAGFSPEQLLILNLVRQHQQVLFESDVFSADGRKLDEKYLRCQPQDETWSTFTFAVHHLQPAHFQLWEEALWRIAHPFNRIDGLGKFMHESHKIWEWRYDSGNDCVLRQNGAVVEVYKHNGEGAGNRGQNKVYTFSHLSQLDISMKAICSIVPELATSLKIAAHTKSVSTFAPECFLDILDDWGCTWLWRTLRISGCTGTGLYIHSPTGYDWNFRAIEEETLVGVTDGSYIREFYPHLCSAALVLECSLGCSRLILSFSEHCLQANTYRGELMGLMALHLLLLSFNRVRPHLTGSVHIWTALLL
jgi:hypothetical protein